MKRLTLALVGTFLLAGSAACADPDSSILITGHKPLEGSLEEVDTDDDGIPDLAFVTDCSRPEQIGEGVIIQDLFINLAEVETTGFSLGLLMENRLSNSATYAPIGEDQNHRIDQNHIEIQGYEIVFDSDDRGFNDLESDGELRYEATGLLPTDGSLWAEIVLFYPSEVGAWRTAFDIASGGQSNAIVPTFAEVQVVGRTVGGSNAESNRLTLPVQICDGCARTSTPICVAVD